MHDHTKPRSPFSAAVLCTLSVLLCGCGGSARIDPVDAETKILAFGDSLTFGYGAEREESYPAVLSRRLGLEVANYGVNGEDTTTGLKRLHSVLSETRPDLVLLCHGGNDLLQEQPEERTRENLKAMIQAIQAEGADVLLVAVPRPALILSVPDFYEVLAESYNLPLEEAVVRKVLSNRSLKSDMVHPNAAGYEKMAEEIHKLIRKSS